MRIYNSEEVVETIQIGLSCLLFAEGKINVSITPSKILVNETIRKIENDVDSVSLNKTILRAAFAYSLPEEKAEPLVNHNCRMQRHPL